MQDAACLAINAGNITLISKVHHIINKRNLSLSLLLHIHDVGADLALGGEFGPNLAACVTAGNVTAARIAQALTRTLTAQFRLGWFDTLAARAQVQCGDCDVIAF